jgi:2-succinyl-5-enolpyruvyl-6-hydroxy-3-cyclohexene-1-carboxylate synthase
MLSTKLDYIAQLLWEAGISNWVVSPGSRNAPIVAALIKHGQFHLHSSPDERSGAFVALGISQINQYPAGFICTSGSALVNAYPAVVEAYYQRIPLVILSADRPEELIDQWDGQTLRQPGIFGNYVRCSWHGNARNESTESLSKGIYHCIQQTLTQIPAAVHLNLALSEPIYEGIELPFEYSEHIPPFVYISTQPEKVDVQSVQHSLFADAQNFDELVQLNKSKIAILVGQNPPSPLITTVLTELQHLVPVFTDICSSQIQIGLKNWDWGMLKRDIPSSLEPDVLISLGTATISKPLKHFLKKSKPKHVHIGIWDDVGDPFETNPEHWKVNEADFLQTIFEILTSSLGNYSNAYLKDWVDFLSDQSLTASTLPHPFGKELQFMQKLFQQANENCIIHLGNSMTVRYGSWSGHTQAQVYSNRGISGIDGCLSTSVGAAIASPEKHNIAILGDVSAMYDSHAMWTELPSNLTIIVYNNGGGRIFDWINGPNKLPELRQFIHTPRKFNMTHLCNLYSVPHFNYSIDQIDVATTEIFKINKPSESGVRFIELIS